MKSTALVPYGQGSPFNIANLLPMFPWEGPPLPRFLNIRWPFLQGGGGFLSSPFTNVETTYTNEETWEWQDYKGRDRKITVTRHAKRS